MVFIEEKWFAPAFDGSDHNPGSSYCTTGDGDEDLLSFEESTYTYGFHEDGSPLDIEDEGDERISSKPVLIVSKDTTSIKVLIFNEYANEYYDDPFKRSEDEIFTIWYTKGEYQMFSARTRRQVELMKHDFLERDTDNVAENTLSVCSNRIDDEGTIPMPSRLVDALEELDAFAQREPYYCDNRFENDEEMCAASDDFSLTNNSDASVLPTHIKHILKQFYENELNTSVLVWSASYLPNIRSSKIDANFFKTGLGPSGRLLRRR